MSAINAREMAAIREGEKPSAWLIVVTKGSCEISVRDRLSPPAGPFETYLPMRLLDELSQKRRGIKAVPLFPRILFARATLDAYRWQQIFTTPGVSRVMCDPSRPRGLRSEFVDRLKAREVRGLLSLGLLDPNAPDRPAPPKDPRKWQKLGDVVDGLLSETVDDRRKSLLVSLLNEGRASLTQDLRRK